MASTYQSSYQIDQNISSSRPAWKEEQHWSGLVVSEKLVKSPVKSELSREQKCHLRAGFH